MKFWLRVYFSLRSKERWRKPKKKNFKWVKVPFWAYFGPFSSNLTHLTCIMVLFYRAQNFSFSILMIFLFFGPKIEALDQKLWPHAPNRPRLLARRPWRQARRACRHGRRARTSSRANEPVTPLEGGAAAKNAPNNPSWKDRILTAK